MTKDNLINTLKEDLKVKKELIIAIKVMKKAPSDVPHYEGQASPGMCALVGEILKDGSLFYTTKENLGCPMALTATGTCENEPRDKFLEFMIDQNREYPMHKDPATLENYYDKVDEFFTYPKVDGEGIVTRAYLGDFTRGFAGMGGCIFTIRYTFNSGDPTFSTSDTAWRMFAGLEEDELTYTFPYPKLLEIADQIKPTAEYVNGFKSMFPLS
ncbi:MAG: DUF169 domain-containing protein [Deltaproteobacteria bacterium]|nr:DUF169 domain-containing protein [Deltaproteobacteria bacterium]